MNSFRFLLYIFPLFLLLEGCAVKNFAYLEKNQDKAKIVTKVDNQTYAKDKLFQWKISSGDRIQIQAYNQSSSASNGQLTQLLSSGGQKFYTQRYGDEGILVPQNGEVLLPLVGNVKLTGLTVEEASKLLIKKYKLYLKHPYVSVTLLNQKLIVVGEVNRPGTVLITNGTMNLFEALAQTGDLTDYANRTNIKILRGSMRNPEVQEVNLNDFNSIKLASLILRPNDIVYVAPRDSKASAVGASEKLPFWQLVNAMIIPFVGGIGIYGVTH